MTIRTRAEAVLLATTFIWGSTFVIVKIGLEDMSAFPLVAIRFTVAALLFLLVFRKTLFPLTRNMVIKGSILSLLLFLGFITQTVGLKFTTASKSAFITGMMVVVVPILQIIVERRPPKLGNIIGVVLVCIGLWLLTSPTGSSFNVGDALTLVCALTFGCYIVYLDIVSRDMSAAQLTFLQSGVTAVFAWIAALIFHETRIEFTQSAILAIAYLTIFATMISTFVQTRFQKDTTPTRAVVIFSIEPVIASTLAYFVLNEVMGGMGIAGGGLILAGVLLSELSDRIPLLDRSMGKV